MSLTREMIDLVKKNFILTADVLETVSDKADKDVDILQAKLLDTSKILRNSTTALNQLAKESNKLTLMINSRNHSAAELDDTYTNVWNLFDSYKKSRITKLDACDNISEIPTVLLDALTFFQPDKITDARTKRILKMSKNLISMRIDRANQLKSLRQSINDQIDKQTEIFQNIQTQLKASNQYIDTALRAAAAEEQKEEQLGLPPLAAASKQPMQSSASSAVVNVKPAPSTSTRVISSKSSVQQNRSPSSLSAVPDPAAPDSSLKLISSRHTMYGENSLALKKAQAVKRCHEEYLQREREKANKPKSKSFFCCGSAM